MTTLQQVRPVLYTERFQGTVDFYTGTLGFVCVARDDGRGWAALARDRIEFNVCLPNAHIPFSGAIFSGSFYMIAEDVTSLWLELKDRTRVCYPLGDFDYGMREFAIYDNNGYLLQFGQEL